MMQQSTASWTASSHAIRAVEAAHSSDPHVPPQEVSTVVCGGVHGSLINELLELDPNDLLRFFKDELFI